MGEVLIVAAEFEISGKGCGLAIGLLGIVLAFAMIKHDRNNRRK